MKYFFILGRNPELSRAELFIYLESRLAKFREVLFESNILILDLKDKFEFNIQFFGGVIGIGSLLEFKNKSEFLDYLSQNEVVEMDKFTYSVVGNVDSHIFSEKFKKDKKKAQIRNFGKKLRFQSGENIFIPNVDAEIFAFTQKSGFFLGLVEQKFSSKQVEERDMKKPYRRESLAISPRLARILINLSGAKEGNLILDPFCGVGGIIQEALLMGINCVGIDIDSEAIDGAKTNLLWLKSKYPLNAQYRLFNLNSMNARNEQYDAIVAESSLGDLLRKKLPTKNAKKYLDDFVLRIVPLLRKFKEIKKKDARIAITFPCFDEVQIKKEEITLATGLRVYSNNDLNFPIVEKRRDQFVNRQIWVFY